MFAFPSSMKPVFKDASLQAAFEKDGFVLVDFYTPDQVEQLIQVYRELHPKDEVGFFPSTFSSDKNYRKRADQTIREVAAKRMQELFIDFQEVCGSFIVKSPDPQSGMCVHQDMSLVDESRFTGVNIWAPLTDLSIQNGAIFVLPGSHRFFPTFRGSSIPEFFSPVMNEIVDYLQPVLINAGKAVVFDQSIIHFSPPNLSDQIRIVTNIFITNSDAEFRTYYWDKNPENKVEIYAQESTFMTDFEQFGQNIHNRPQVGTLIDTEVYGFPKITAEFLAKHCEPTQARSLIEKEWKAYQDAHQPLPSPKKWWQKIFG